MGWKCSVCSKEFAKTNQSHICVQANIQTLFLRSAPEVLKAYEYMIQQLRKHLQFTITASSRSVTLYAPNHKAFFVMKPGKSFLESFFMLNEKVEEFPVYKVVQPSKTRYAHFMRFYSVNDIDKVVLSFIKQSYDYIMQKG